MIVLNDLDKWALILPMLDHSKSTKMPFWMIQIAKNKVFGHFLELGASDRLQIAYHDCTKWSWQVGSHIAHAGSFKNHRNAFLNDPKSQKWVFFYLFLEFGCSDQLDIAYDGTPKCFSTNSSGYRSCTGQRPDFLRKINFFRNVENRSIWKLIMLKSIFQHPGIFSTTGLSEASLRNFRRKT